MTDLSKHIPDTVRADLEATGRVLADQTRQAVDRLLAQFPMHLPLTERVAALRDAVMASWPGVEERLQDRVPKFEEFFPPAIATEDEWLDTIETVAVTLATAAIAGRAAQT